MAMNMNKTVAKVKGVILGYRRGNAIQYNNQVFVKIFVEPRVVSGFVGAKVLAVDAYGNTYKGRVIKVHGRKNSVVIAKFKPNIPGQLIGAYIDVIKK
uniref:Large ribosomal subunit protein eL33 n=1 Tax=Ignisphaera aggregans TaxID=334771 RepID=A0A7C4JIQ4_9CREN